MRSIAILLFAATLVAPQVASGQSFEIYGAAGPTVTDPGNSVVAGAGVSGRRFALLASVERTHLSSQSRTSGNVIANVRGGTLLLGTAELRAAMSAGHRVRPFALAGFAAGQSRPNVNDVFTNPVTNRVHGFFAGGGVQVPLGPHLTLSGDARLLIAVEGNDDVVAAIPRPGGCVVALLNDGPVGLLGVG